MGAFKPLVPFRGRPLIAWPADALRPLCAELLVAHGPRANAAPLAAAVPDARLLADEGPGPLGGLVVAAREAKGAWLLVAPADAPFLVPALYEALLDAASGKDGAAFVVDGELQPLVAALRRDAFLPAAEGARSVWGAMGRMRMARVDGARWRDALRDVDAPADLADAQTRGPGREGPEP